MFNTTKVADLKNKSGKGTKKDRIYEFLNLTTNEQKTNCKCEIKINKLRKRFTDE